MNSDMEDALLDPVTFELLREACILSCGHSFNASTLSEWLSKESRCPLCQTDVVDGDQKPNYALRSVVQAFESAQASPSAPEIVANEAAASSSSEVNSPPAPSLPERPPSPEMTPYNPNMLVPNVVWDHRVELPSIFRQKGRNIFTALAAAYKQEQLLAFRRNALENFIYSKQVILASMTLEQTPAARGYLHWLLNDITPRIDALCIAGAENQPELFPCTICKRWLPNEAFSSSNEPHDAALPCCDHRGRWHATLSDCSWLVCGAALAVRGGVGKQHWNCCWKLNKSDRSCPNQRVHVRGMKRLKQGNGNMPWSPRSPDLPPAPEAF